MSTEIISQQSNASLIAAIKASVYPDASENAILMALEYCRQLKLDIMLKPIHIVTYGNRETIVPGINLFRTIAARSGSYVGQSEAVFSETVTEMVGRTKVTFPLACKVVVKRLVNGHIAEFTGTAIWKESYSFLADKVSPTIFWIRRPFSQLEKCAEMNALRRAFPDLIGAQPTIDEAQNFHSYEEDITPTQSSPSLAVINTSDEIKAKFTRQQDNQYFCAEAENQKVDLETGEVIEPPNHVKHELLAELKEYIGSNNISQETIAQWRAKECASSFTEFTVEQLKNLMDSLNKQGV